MYMWSRKEEMERNGKKDAVQASFDCEICDFKSNRESGLKIHMSKKHATIEQLDGNTEEVLQELDSDCDDQIEHYLRTGEIAETNIQLWEDIMYYLGSNPQNLTVLNAKMNRQEKLIALEAWKQCIDNKFGPGDHLDWTPWKM